jgi:hypothetical protein
LVKTQGNSSSRNLSIENVTAMEVRIAQHGVEPRPLRPGGGREKTDSWR